MGVFTPFSVKYYKYDIFSLPKILHIWNICIIFATENKTNNNLEPAATDKRHKIMTQQEFTQRVNVEVSNSEFEAINVVYMNSDLDKDEFCKMWMKMNKTRVEIAKYERTKKAKEEAYRDALHKFYHKTSNKDQWVAICYVKVSVKELQAMAYANISFANECGSGLKVLYDVRYEIGKFLGMY